MLVTHESTATGAGRITPNHTSAWHCRRCTAGHCLAVVTAPSACKWLTPHHSVRAASCNDHAMAGCAGPNRRCSRYVMTLRAVCCCVLRSLPQLSVVGDGGSSSSSSSKAQITVVSVKGVIPAVTPQTPLEWSSEAYGCILDSHDGGVRPELHLLPIPWRHTNVCIHSQRCGQAGTWSATQAGNLQDKLHCFEHATEAADAGP